MSASKGTYADKTSGVAPDGAPQSSIYRGVSLHKGTMKYRATIKIKGTKISLGSFDDEVEAAKAFDRAALRYRGHRAEVNFPQECRPAPKRQKIDHTCNSKAKARTEVAPREGLRSRAVKPAVETDQRDAGPESGAVSDETQYTQGLCYMTKPRSIKPLYTPFGDYASRVDDVDPGLLAEALAVIDSSVSYSKENSCMHSDTADSTPMTGAESRELETASSHGLNVLKAKFQLNRFNSSANSSSSPSHRGKDLERLSSQQSTRGGLNAISRKLSTKPSSNLDSMECVNYRQLLMNRAYADYQYDSDLSRGSVQANWAGEWRRPAPITFYNPGEANARYREWCNMQFQLAQEQQFLSSLLS